jgi:hypothetical protein
MLSITQRSINRYNITVNRYNVLTIVDHEILSSDKQSRYNDLLNRCNCSSRSTVPSRYSTIGSDKNDNFLTLLKF